MPNLILNDLELLTLEDVVEGLSDKMISKRCFISMGAVQARLQTIMDKLGIEGKSSAYNPRCRLIFIVLSRGIISLPEETK